MDLYAENILDHYRDPRCRGQLTHPSVTHGEANHACGDEVTLQLTVEDGRIAALAWEGTGCAISQAGMSILSEELEGMALDEAAALQKDDVYELLGVPVGPRRFKCALICLHTLKNTIHRYRGEPVQGWIDTVELDEE